MNIFNRLISALNVGDTTVQEAQETKQEKALRLRRVEHFLKEQGLSRKQAVGVAQIIEVLKNENS